MSTAKPELDIDTTYKFGWHDPANYVFEPKKGLNADIVREISMLKGEPEWMTKFRLRSLEIFEGREIPDWGGDLSELDYQDIYYYIKAAEEQGRSWDDVPDDIRKTFDRLGIPEAEQKFLAGVSAQYESEVVYHSIREDLEQKGVIFCDTDTALREHEDLFREHWATVIPPGDNTFAALNSAVWSGGSFIWELGEQVVVLHLQARVRLGPVERVQLRGAPRAGATAPRAALELRPQEPLLHQLVQVEPRQPAGDAHGLGHLVLAHQHPGLAHREEHPATRGVAERGDHPLDLLLVVGKGCRVGRHASPLGCLPRTRIRRLGDGAEPVGSPVRTA